MTVLGFLGDRIGRKWGSVCTACIMLLGATMLTCSNGANPKGFTVMFLVSQCVFGCARQPLLPSVML
jgi:MFS family permease